MSASPEHILCDSGNAWYAGGPGDFVVYREPEKEYFYFANYPNEFSEQGLSLARMKYDDRDDPVGNVWRYHEGEWNEPGLEGHSTPMLPATVDVFRANGQAYWGPVLHWNTFLNKYVMILKWIQDTKWTTEGIYLSFSDSISDPNGWSEPVKVMTAEEARSDTSDGKANGWYAQLMGTCKGETGKVASQTVHLLHRRTGKLGGPVPSRQHCEVSHRRQNPVP